MNPISSPHRPRNVSEEDKHNMTLWERLQAARIKQ